MLTTLRISGFAVVDAVEVRFGPGLNVLTGETGAGKSILVNALHLVLGGRMSAEVLRDGADEAVVEALFELPAAHPVLARLAAAGLGSASGQGGAAGRPDETCELLVRRVASRGGRGRAFVNGALCTLAMLEQALRGMVDISGQHEHVSLLDESTHLDLLDAHAGTAVAPDDAAGEAAEPLLSRYRAAHAALAALVRERDALAADEGERARRADYVAFQLAEIDRADPRPGELEALEDERRVLASAEKLREAARAAEALAYGEEGSASERVGQAARALAEAALLDRRLEPTLALLRSAAVELGEAGRELGRYA
ncbi:MAG TPA: AAA family ATPase, partial [Anaeromyxobacteraceae bacterium]|nr:AAA family ATPase [Anaeromyxobacteraceae bacterium]